MNRLTRLALLLVMALLLTHGATAPRAATTFVASPAGNDAAGTPCTDAQPCSVRRGMITMSCANNDVLELLDGTYTGTNYMILPAVHVPGKSGSDNTHRCTVRARNDGKAVIDANYDQINGAVWVDGNNWWTFEGFDIIRGGVFTGLSTTTGLIFRRICASNMLPNAVVRGNMHPWSVNNLTDSLLEDICGFGTGRNMYVSPGNHNTTVRRAWMRHEGYGGFPGDTACDGGPAGQWGYHSGEPYNTVYEDVITASTYEQLGPGMPCYAPSFPIGPYADSLDAGRRGRKALGFIIYVRDPVRFAMNHSGFIQRVFCTTDGGTWRTADIYMDTRNYKIPPFSISREEAAAPCGTVDRLTSLKTTAADNDSWAYNNGNTNYSSFTGVTPTNWKECAGEVGATGPNIGGCPNFYTGAPGSAGGNGARNCYEYLDGVLQDGTGGAGTVKKWPWRMDDRIKAALKRESDRGQGGSPLAGGAGVGYFAGTVTSEIASRYGEIPTACNRVSGSPFVPNFPVATDFPSTPVLDNFNRSNGAIGVNWINTFDPNTTPFTIFNNQAAGPGGTNFARMQWAGGVFSGTHEVWALWPVTPNCCTALTFAGVAGSDVNQWRLALDPSGGNTHAAIRKVDGAGSAPIVFGPIDLGTDISSTPSQGFGIRVSATKTISIYWKWTDGNWYRVGSFIDMSLPSANAAIGFAGGGSVVVEDAGGGTCCGGAVSPSNIGRFGNLFPKQ